MEQVMKYLVETANWGLIVEAKNHKAAYKTALKTKNVETMDKLPPMLGLCTQIEALDGSGRVWLMTNVKVENFLKKYFDCSSNDIYKHISSNYYDQILYPLIPKDRTSG